MRPKNTPFVSRSGIQTNNEPLFWNESDARALDRKMTLCIVSSISGAANGGEAAYIRCLGNHFVKLGHVVFGVSRLRLVHSEFLNYALSDAGPKGGCNQVSCGGWSCRLVGPQPTVTPLLRLLPYLMSRPIVNRLSGFVFRAAYDAPVLDAMPGKIDVVHYVGTGWELLGYSALHAARMRRAVFTITPFVHPDQWGDSRFDVRFYNQADAVYVCSEYERNHLEKKGVHSRRIHRTAMAPAGVQEADANRFRMRWNLGDRPVILFLGRKQRYKGYHVLCLAMKEVIAAIPEVCLAVAGAEVEPPFPAVAKENFLDLGELTTSTGHVQHKADALAACDVFCMPSTAEAFGLVYAEAWHYGKPVIGGMAPALEELIIDDVNGYRVEQDKTQLAARLIQLLQNEGLRRRMGDEGRRIQQEKYTWPAVSSRHLQIWTDLHRASVNHL